MSWNAFQLPETANLRVYILFRLIDNNNLEILSLDGINYLWSDSEEALFEKLEHLKNEPGVVLQNVVCDSSYIHYQHMMDTLKSQAPVRTSSLLNWTEPSNSSVFTYSGVSYEVTKTSVVKKTASVTTSVNLSLVIVLVFPCEPNVDILICHDSSGLNSFHLDFTDGTTKFLNSFFCGASQTSINFNESDGGIYLTLTSPPRIYRCRDPYMNSESWEKQNENGDWTKLEDTLLES